MNIFELFASSSIVNNSEYFEGLIGYFFSAQAIIILIGFISLIVGFIFYIRWWFAQSAIFDMRDDLREIKEYLIKDSYDEESVPEILPKTEEIESDEAIVSTKETSPVAIADAQKHIGRLFSKKLPRWLLIALMSIGLAFVLAILYMNFFI